MNQDIQNIAEAIRKAVPAERIYLFGSYVYSTPNKDSDYDFYIIISDGSMRPIEAMQKAQVALCSLDPSIPAVDIIASTQGKFDAMRNRINTVEKDVAQKGVLIYERHGLGA